MTDHPRESLSRRDALRLAALAGLGGIAAGCTNLARRQVQQPLDLDNALASTQPEIRLLNRLGFGANQHTLQQLKAMGKEAYIAKQLQADENDDPALLFALSRLDILRMDGEELQDLPQEDILRQLQQAAILRATYGPNQLEERMADFWTNHFNIYARKEGGAYRKSADEERVIRKHALGKFSDLLRASSHSPAMLAYLDNQVNRKGVANENYARELLELHTLGVDGGYSQKDVQEVARCFTGWTVETRFLRPVGKFVFREELHDDGYKVVLGHKIAAGGGENDAEQVLEILSKHPATAKFIAGKLCAYFLGDPNHKAAAQMEKRFLDSGGDMRAILQPTLMSNDLLDSQPIVKRPFDYAISALRVTEAVTDGARGIQEYLQKMGQPLYQWPMPDGYPDTTAAWTGSLLSRWNFAMALAENRIGGTQIRLEDEDDLRSQTSKSQITPVVLGTESGRPTEVLKDFAGTPREELALALAAPAFQWR